jgi:hypothetical protein
MIFIQILNIDNGYFLQVGQKIACEHRQGMDGKE